MESLKRTWLIWTVSQMSLRSGVMFTKIIANPPYGRSSSLSKKIVKTLLENKVAKEMVVLAPQKTFGKIGER